MHPSIIRITSQKQPPQPPQEGRLLIRSSGCSFAALFPKLDALIGQVRRRSRGIKHSFGTGGVCPSKEATRLSGYPENQWHLKYWFPS